MKESRKASLTVINLFTDCIKYDTVLHRRACWVLDLSMRENKKGSEFLLKTGSPTPEATLPTEDN